VTFTAFVFLSSPLSTSYSTTSSCVLA
jgi:hypothetical protein